MIDITLITSVLNGMPYLEPMLESIPSDARVEHIAVDAGSTDGSRERLAAVGGLQLIECPGLPLYDAWNQGVAAARGRYVWFVNADDVLTPAALPNALAALAQHHDADVLAGGADAFAAETTVWHYRGDSLTGFAPQTLMFGAVLVNAKLIRRDMILARGGFDTTYAFAADRDFLLRLSLDGPQVKLHQLAAPLYRYRIHSSSKTLQPSSARRVDLSLEHQRIARHYLQNEVRGSATAELLEAWLAHEQAVSVIRGAARGRLGLALGAAAAFAYGAPQSIRALLLARRTRRYYHRTLLEATFAADRVPQ